MGTIRGQDFSHERFACFVLLFLLFDDSLSFQCSFCFHVRYPGQRMGTIRGPDFLQAMFLLFSFIFFPFLSLQPSLIIHSLISVPVMGQTNTNHRDSRVYICMHTTLFLHGNSLHIVLRPPACLLEPTYKCTRRTTHVPKKSMQK